MTGTVIKSQDPGTRPVRAVVLAAGKGKRLQSESFDLPKVMRQAAGRPLLDWVLAQLDFLSPADIVIVVGYQADKVRAHCGEEFRYALQAEQLGTGHAVAAARPELADFEGDVVVAFGDMPLVSKETYLSLLRKHQSGTADCTMLTALVSNPPAFGRIVRDADGRFIGIVEERDCTPEQRLIREVNPSVYVFRSKKLFEMLSRLSNHNAQGEYYLTDVPGLLLQSGGTVDTVLIDDEEQVIGVNNEHDLAQAEEALRRRYG